MDIPVREGSMVYRLLRVRLWSVPRERAEKARITYGLDDDGTCSTSPLGILNGLFGLRMRVR